MELFLLLGPLFLLAGVGVITYGVFTMRKEQARPRSKPRGERVIVECSACKKKLRLPKGYGSLKITCPGCSHSFTHRT